MYDQMGRIGSSSSKTLRVMVHMLNFMQERHILQNLEDKVQMTKMPPKLENEKNALMLEKSNIFLLKLNIQNLKYTKS